VPVINLQGALGKTSGRSYKAAPRQLLQVDPSNSSSYAHKEDAIRKHGEGAAKEAAKIGAEALGVTVHVRPILPMLMHRSLVISRMTQLAEIL
jgi:DNA topoisomerase 2-associated protein PAT1